MILIGLTTGKRTASTAEGVLFHYENILNLPHSNAPLFHTEKGAPYFEGINVYVSASHSGTYTIVALSSAPIGIDIQEKKEIDFKKIASRYGFTANDVNEFYKKYCIAECYTKLSDTPLPTALKQADTLNGIEITLLADYEICYISKENTTPLLLI